MEATGVRTHAQSLEPGAVARKLFPSLSGWRWRWHSMVDYGLPTVHDSRAGSGWSVA